MPNKTADFMTTPDNQNRRSIALEIREPLSGRLACLLPLIIFCFGWIDSIAQVGSDIPLGTWRTHLSYTAVKNVEVSATRIFAASQGGLFELDRSDLSLRSYSKLDGFSDVNISAMRYVPSLDMLIIGYENGNIDLFKGNIVTNINAITRTTLVGSKRINSIEYQNGNAYLGCDFGLVVVNVAKAEIRSSNTQIGSGSSAIRISGTAILNDSLFLATDEGVKSVSLQRNLMNSSNYRSYGNADGISGQPLGAITVWQNKVYVANANFANGQPDVNNGIYCKQGTRWTRTNLGVGSIRKLVSKGDSLYIVINNQVTAVGPNGGAYLYNGPLFTEPQDVDIDETGHLWMGDIRSGLVGNPEGQFMSFKSNGPYANSYVRLQASSNRILAAAGTIDIAGYRALGNRSGYAVFENNQWDNTNVELGNFAFDAVDVTDVAYNPTDGATYAATYGRGIIIKKADGSFDALTEGVPASSGLVRLFRGTGGDTAYVRISAVRVDNQGKVWMLNFGSIAGKTVIPLHRYDPVTKLMKAFPVPIPNVTWENGMDFVIANNNDKWMVLANRQDINGGGGFNTVLGILVFNTETNKAVQINTGSLTGELPGNIVYDLAKDTQGAIWVAMNKGFGVFFNPSAVFSSSFKISLPIINGRPVLENDVVRAIAIDGADRKWVAANTGVYLFDKDVTRVMATYTAENSPLISNNVNDITINPVTGEVFFSTDVGICSFRGDATGVPGEQARECKDLKIFPQPVPINFEGTVSISGVPFNSMVKITDLNGKLVWETKSNGNTATWTGRDYNGDKAKTGIYTVFIASEDGSTGCVSKIAVVE